MNNNSVTLIDYMGSDKLHSLSAWASTFLELEIEMPAKIENRVDAIVDYILANSKRMRSIEDLLRFLAENEHESPFRMSGFVFTMTTEIATHIQKLKHAVILEAENGESARYKELKEGKFYLPSDWLDYGDVGYYWYHRLKSNSEALNQFYSDCLSDLIDAGMPKARAKESARYWKMYNSQINTVNKFSFDGVMQFAKKRGTSHAQKEIREIALQMVQAVKDIEGKPFEYSLKAFGY